VGADQRRVKIDHDALGRRASIPSVLSRLAARRAQRVQQHRVMGDRVDHPKRGRVRSDRPEQRPLVADRTQVGQTVAAVGDHHRQIAHHPTRTVPATPLAHRRQRPRQRRGQP
jgi:hypothetical protein